MKKYLILLLALAAALGTAAAQTEENISAESDVPAGLTSASPLYGVELFVEGLEVRLAGVIGGNDLKAKAMANNAEERISEAQKLVENNRSTEAARAIERYSKTINKSVETASKGKDVELKQKINNISNQNIKALKDVQQKVPEEAQGSIQKAIQRSEARNRGKGPRGTPSNNRPNTERSPFQRQDSPNMGSADPRNQDGDLSSEQQNPVKSSDKTENVNSSGDRDSSPETGETEINETPDISSLPDRR